VTASPYGPCPNCESDEIVRTTSARVQIEVAPLRAATLAHMICLNCGFVRQWLDDRAALDQLRKKLGDQLRLE